MEGATALPPSPASMPVPLWRKLKERGVTPGDLLAQFQIEAAPVDVRGLVQQLGIHLHEVASPGWSGAVTSNSERADVWVNLDEPLYRQRFTLAHELGHLFLDPLGSEFRDANFSGPRESRVNRFAADLLMPLWLLSQQADLHQGNALQLSRVFGVSEQALKIRLSLL